MKRHITHAGSIRDDIDQACRQLVEPRLLGLDHVLVLDKGRRDLAIELVGRLGFDSGDSRWRGTGNRSAEV